MKKLIYAGYDLHRCSASVCAHLCYYAEYSHSKNEAIFYIRLDPDNDSFPLKRIVSFKYFLRLVKCFRLPYKAF